MNALDPAGIHAERIAKLTWFFGSVSAVVSAAVIGFLVYALFRRHATDPAPEEVLRSRALTAVSAATAASVVVLLVLLGSSLVTGRELSSLRDRDALRIELVGHQWWWEVRYPGDGPGDLVVTANEIHVPVGRTVRIEGTSRDVIHSFAVPELAGKIDLIPSRRNVTWFRADRAGRFRGQCAEFCGTEHAMMALEVVAESQADFERWLSNSASPAPEPQTDEEKRGRAILETAACAVCHNVSGTAARGTKGPDLTHVASRRLLLAGTRPNNPGWMAAWIADPQTLKPGAKMPATAMDGEDLQALVAYLETLK